MSEKYSAGLISQCFWFIEIRKVIDLIIEKKTSDEIKRLCIEENLFGASTEHRAKSIFGYINTRVKCMDDELIQLFEGSDVETQKIINLIIILKNDRLFLDFVFEVYRENIIVGKNYIELEDINVFFDRKELQIEKVNNFAENTKKRLKKSYITFLMEANLIVYNDGKKKITPPLLDNKLKSYLLRNNEEIILKAITGAASI